MKDFTQGKYEYKAKPYDWAYLYMLLCQQLVCNLIGMHSSKNYSPRDRNVNTLDYRSPNKGLTLKTEVFLNKYEESFYIIMILFMLSVNGFKMTITK